MKDFLKVIKKNKWLMLVLVWFSIVSILYLIWNNTNISEEEISSPEEEETVVKEVDFDFDYPEDWSVESEDYTDEEQFLEVYTLQSASEDFIVEIEYKESFADTDSKVVSQESFYIEDVPLISYQESDFELLTVIDDTFNLLVPVAGATKYNIAGYFESAIPIIDESNYVYQQYITEDGDNKLSLVISCLNDELIDAPQIYDGLTISYIFKTQDSVYNWDNYKKDLLEIIQSITKN